MRSSLPGARRRSSSGGSDARRARRSAAILLVGLLASAGCGHSTGPSARARGCTNALDGRTAAAVAHGRPSILAASRAEAGAWAALSVPEQHRQIAACTAHGGAPTIGR